MGRTAIIGAGVIGLGCAYELTKRGHEVVVLDKGQPGKGSSEGNAGWVTPSLAVPLPAPGLVGTSLRWMLRSDSPLYIRPRLNPAFVSWVWRFWRACRDEPYRAGLEAMFALGEDTMPLFDAWQREGLSFEMKQLGMLFVGTTGKGLVATARDLELMAQYGYPTAQRLRPSEVHDLEPNIRARVVGGLLLDCERSVRPERLTKALEEAVLERGGEVKANTPVTGVRMQRGEVRGIDTPQGTIECDSVLIAAGAWSGEVGRLFDVSLPIEAGKGYSITVDMPQAPIGRSIDVIERRVALTPFDGAFRMAGTMELSGLNLKIRQERVDAIKRATNWLLGDWGGGTNEQVWVGMRPLTPDGLPVIGKLPGFSNAFVATGHQMLGVTLAPSTARVVSALMLGEDPGIPMAPFDPARFN